MRLGLPLSHEAKCLFGVILSLTMINEGVDYPI